MKLGTIIATIVIAAIGSFAAHAQIETAMKSYNFSRALEEAKKGNNADAMDFLNKEVAENPNNGYAYFYMAVLQADAENYSDAMSHINTAI